MREINQAKYACRLYYNEWRGFELISMAITVAYSKI